MAEREHPRKSINGAPQLTHFLGPRTHTHTHNTNTATASDYSGRFPPSTGTQDEGGKNTIIRYHSHRTIHMSTTSRDAIPQGRPKNKTSHHLHQDSFASMAQNIIICDFQYPTIIITIAAAAATTTTIRHGLHIVRREQVGLHIHPQPYTYTPDFSRQRKEEVSRSREIRKDSQTPLPQKILPRFPQSKYLSLLEFPFPFTYSTVLPGRLGGKGHQGGSPAFGFPFSSFSYIFFHFISFLVFP